MLVGRRGGVPHPLFFPSFVFRAPSANYVEMVASTRQLSCRRSGSLSLVRARPRDVHASASLCFEKGKKKEGTWKFS